MRLGRRDDSAVLQRETEEVQATAGAKLQCVRAIFAESAGSRYVVMVLDLQIPLLVVTGLGEAPCVIKHDWPSPYLIVEIDWGFGTKQISHLCTSAQTRHLPTSLHTRSKQRADAGRKHTYC